MKRIDQNRDSKYESPTIKTIVLKVEKGFAASLGSADWYNNDPNNLEW